MEPLGLAQCADRGEDYGGGRTLPKLKKYEQKWKTEVEAKDGVKNLEDLAGVQHADLGAADRFAHTAGPG